MLVTGITVAAAVLAVVVCILAGWSLWLLPVVFFGGWLALVVLAFGFLWVVCALVRFDKPQEHDNKFYRTVMDLYIQAVITLVQVRVHKKGLEKLPQDGRFLLVCNHLSDADPPLLLNAFPKAELAFISKKENQKLFLVGKIMHKIMCQMIDRNNDREALKTILKCIQLIREDEVNIGVFPEGWCSLDGRLQHFRPGVFKIAQKTGVPVVVCTVRNTAQIFENLPKLKPTDVELHLVGVITPEEYKGLTTVELSNKAFEMMLGDLGPDFAPIAADNT